MSYDAKVILLIVLTIAVSIFAIGILQSWLGKPFRGTLRVPQGKSSLDVIVCDDKPLRPFKYDQVFDVTVVPGEQIITNSTTHAPQTGYGALSHRGTLFGFVDDANQYGHHLSDLAQAYTKVTVCATVIGIDSDGRPLVRLKFPGTSWFAKALVNAAKSKH